MRRTPVATSIHSRRVSWRIRLWLWVPCWVAHFWLMADPLKDPREMWCSKCNRRRMTLR